MNRQTIQRFTRRRQDGWDVALTRPAKRTESSRIPDPLAWHSAARTVLSLSYSRTPHLPPPPESAKDRRETDERKTRGKEQSNTYLKQLRPPQATATNLETTPVTTRNNQQFETNPATTRDDHQEKNPSLWGRRRRAKVPSSCTKDSGHHLFKKNLQIHQHLHKRKG
ncbi:hypothetical protein LIER_02780 [Lithospermum erythrorhizon]|uniref:Uncharacterized protein n=1 Tax=Lithospermum erythrorhizon TaxID=34254 RepID=A0AAV3NTC5_LITER